MPHTEIYLGSFSFNCVTLQLMKKTLIWLQRNNSELWKYNNKSSRFGTDMQQDSVYISMVHHCHSIYHPSQLCFFFFLTQWDVKYIMQFLCISLVTLGAWSRIIYTEVLRVAGDTWWGQTYLPVSLHRAQASAWLSRRYHVRMQQAEDPSEACFTLLKAWRAENMSDFKEVC